MSELTPEHWQQIGAMNARTYAMSDADREQWYRDHPASEFAYPGENTLAERARNRAAQAAADAAEAISLGRYDDARMLLAESGRHLDRVREAVPR